MILAQVPSDYDDPASLVSTKAPSTIKLLQPHLGPQYSARLRFFNNAKASLRQRYLSQNLTLADYINLKWGKLKRVSVDKRRGRGEAEWKLAIV